MKLVEVAMFTDRVDAMAVQWAALLGVPPRHRDDDIAVFETNGIEYLIHARYEPGEDELPPEDHTAFEVADLDGEMERLCAAGWTVAHAPRDWPWGRSGYLRDPDGRLVELQPATSGA